MQTLNKVSMAPQGDKTRFASQRPSWQTA